MKPFSFLTPKLAAGLVMTAGALAGAGSIAAPAWAAGTPPGAPSAVRAMPSQGAAIVQFTEPSDGGSPITAYKVTAIDLTRALGDISEGYPGSAVHGSSGFVVAGELLGGDSYTFTVTATSAAGTGPASPRSNVVTVQPVTGGCTPVTCRPVH